MEVPNAVQAVSAAELSVALAGPKNTSVRLTLARQRPDGSSLEIEREVRRERIDREGNAIPVATMLDRRTGYVRIATFDNAKVADQLHAAVERLKSAGMARLVLDLRDNGGGLVDQAAEVAGEFLAAGRVYTSETKKGKPDTVKVKRSFWRSEDRYPVVAMVNAGTASASELVGGALQDHDRAVIVGRPSFGKSLMMQGLPLLDGSAIMLVIGRIRTPCGRIVQREYRSITRRDYYRLSAADRDTVDRPSCSTSKGRRVFGGGGIYPDVVLPEPAAPPAWLARILEDELPLKWAGGYLTQAALVSVDSLVARPEAIAPAVTSFREFAVTRKFDLPTGDDADRWLRRILLLELASVKWGEEGYYRVVVAQDAAIVEAMASFDRAIELNR
jgi:carboxyl-terminal processing protease